MAVLHIDLYTLRLGECDDYIARSVQLIERIKREDTARHAIYLRVEPENKNAEALYTSLGFAHAEKIEEGELVMKFTD